MEDDRKRCLDAGSAARAQPALDSCDYPLTRPLALLVAATAAEILRLAKLRSK